MAFMRATFDEAGRPLGEGERVAPPPPKVVRYTDDEIRQVRAADMVVKHRSGWHVADIAKLYKITPRRVYQEMGDVPGWMRRKIIEAHLNGKVGLA